MDSKEIEKAQENTLFNQPVNTKSLGISGLIGYSMQDLPIPYLKLVQKMTEDKIGSDGKEAKEGQLMHSVTKQVYDKLPIVVLYAKKGNRVMQDEKTKEMIGVEEHKLMACTLDKKEPFVIFLRKANTGAWKKFLGNLLALKIKYLFDYEITVSSDTYTNKDGRSYKVFKFEQGRKLTEDEVKEVFNVASNFDPSLLDKTDEEDKKPEIEDDVNLEDIPF